MSVFTSSNFTKSTAAKQNSVSVYTEGDRIGLEVGEEQQKFTCDPEGGVIVTELVCKTPTLEV
jgi:hypothetical protein